MSKLLSLKIDERVFDRAERLSRQSHISRNAYINKAVDFYNRYLERRSLKVELHKESLLVRDESLKILHDFEMLEDKDPS